jgi:hypothetical protein
MRLHDSYGLYTLAQLRADPSTADHAAFFAEAMTGLSRRFREQRRAAATTIACLAARDRILQDLVEALRSFNYAVKRQAQGDRTCPIYLTYFPATIADVVGGTPEECVAKAGAIVTQLETETIPGIRTHAEAIATTLEAARSALQRLREARETQSVASRMLHQQKIDWLDVYRQVHARLRIHHHRSPSLAERYFRRRKAVKRDAAEEVKDSNVDGMKRPAPARTEITKEDIRPGAPTLLPRIPDVEGGGAIVQREAIAVVVPRGGEPSPASRGTSTGGSGSRAQTGDLIALPRGATPRGVLVRVAASVDAYGSRDGCGWGGWVRGDTGRRNVRRIFTDEGYRIVGWFA